MLGNETEEEEQEEGKDVVEKVPLADYEAMVKTALRQTENNLHSLREVITQLAERTPRSRHTSHHKVTISKVTPRFVPPDMDMYKHNFINLKREPAPEWLVSIADIYQAICKAFAEVQVELQQRSAEFMHQKASLLKLKERCTPSESPVMEEEEVTEEDKELQQQIEEATTAMESHTLRMHSKEMQYSKVEANMEDISGSMNKMKTKMKELEEMIAKEQERLSSLSERVCSLSLQLSSLEKEKGELDLQLQCEEEEYNLLVLNLSSSISMIEEKKKHLESNISKASEDLEYMVDSLATTKENIVLLKDKRAVLETQRLALEDRVKQRKLAVEAITLQVEGMKQNAMDQTSLKISLQKTCRLKVAEGHQVSRERKSVLTAKEHHLNDIKRSVGEDLAITKCLQEEVEKCEEIMRSKKVETEDMERQKKDMEERAAQLREQYKSIIEQIITMKEQLSEARAASRKVEGYM